MFRGTAGIRGIRQSFLRIGDGVEEQLDAFRAGLGFQFPAHVGKGVEKELANIGLSEGVAPVDPLPGHQFEEIAEKEIDIGGRAEILEGTQELGHSFVVPSALGQEAAEMVRAQTLLRVGREHPATMASGIDVGAALTVRNLDGYG